MNDYLYLLIASKFLKICDCDNDSAIYSILPSIDSKHPSLSRQYCHMLETQKNLIECSIEIFTGKRTDIARSSFEYMTLKGKKDEFLNLINKDISNDITKIEADRTQIALSLLTHLYIDTFLRPIQFFLPLTSVCSGQWDFWDKIDYIKLKERLSGMQSMSEIRINIEKSEIWNRKFKPADFPEIITRRLTKEKQFNKNLNPSSMIKALIIRMGELANPPINYEIVDLSIRRFFTYLGNKEYLRVDREIYFLREFEEELKKILLDT